jgi:chitin synthase
MVEDPLRAQGKEVKHGSREGEEEEDYAPDDNTDFTHPPAGSIYFGESVEHLVLTRTGTDGTMYKDPNARYGSGGLRGPAYGSKSLAPPDDPAAWNTESDKQELGTSELLPYSTRGGDGPEKGTDGTLVVKEAPVEEVPSSKTRRWWLRLVWLCTWWIPSFCLNHIGRMKRPDVRMAWREKITIFWLIFIMNGIVIFYIVEFGRLLYPNFDKAWSLNEVNQHTGDNDFWVAIQGVVYDVTNFIHGDHSNGEFGVKSNSPDILEVIAGQDLTYYFPPPLVLGCSGDDNLFLSRRISHLSCTIPVENCRPQVRRCLIQAGMSIPSGRDADHEERSTGLGFGCDC